MQNEDSEPTGKCTSKSCNDETMESMQSDANNNDNYSSQASPSSIPFWGEDPNVLFKPSYLTELFPSEPMSYNQKLNAITRLVLVVSIVVVAVSQNLRSAMIAGITLFAIYMVHQYHNKEREKEKFSDLVRDTLEQEGIDASTAVDVFDSPDSHNPFSNVLMTDYTDNVNKKPAPPSYNKHVSNDILSQAKQLVRDVHPDQPELADKLFHDLGEQYTFEQSMRPFYSTSNTTIPNDQQAFAEFCYGSMVSCKEGNKFACARNLARHTM